MTETTKGRRGTKRPFDQLTSYRKKHDVQWALFLRKDGFWHIGTAQVTRGGTDLALVDNIMVRYPRVENVEELKAWIEKEYMPEEQQRHKRRKERSRKKGELMAKGKWYKNEIREDEAND